MIQRCALCDGIVWKFDDIKQGTSHYHRLCFKKVNAA